MRSAVAALALAAAFAHVAPARADVEPRRATGPAAAAAAALEARGATIVRTLELLAAKREEQAAITARRLRALYKLTRAGHAPLWFDRAARGRLARQRGASRVIARDVAELAMLEREAAAARAAAARIAAARTAPVAAPPPPRSLVRPVPGAIAGGFGAYRTGKVALRRDGVELAATAGEAVRAPAAGVVRHVGPLRGLGTAVVLDHGDATTIVGRLASAAPSVGARVAAGDPLGVAAGRTIHLAVRLRGGDPAGFPVDPAPLLAR